MCLVACLAEMWARSECYDQMVKRIRRRKRVCRGLFQYKLERWRAARARRKWIKRELDHQREMNNDSPIQSDMLPVDRLNLDTSKRNQPPGLGSTDIAKMNKLVTRQTSDHNNPTVIDIPPCCSSVPTSEDVDDVDVEIAKYLNDERITLFLQNDEFINELRSNQEFMNSLQDYEGGSVEDLEFGSPSRNTSLTGAQKKMELHTGVMSPLDDATMKVRLAAMGKASRSQFLRMAKIFSLKKGRGGQQLFFLSGRGREKRENIFISSDCLIPEYTEVPHPTVRHPS